MAGPYAPAARAKSVQNDYGATAGPHAPASWLIFIFDGHPEFGGVELDDTSCPGYERLVAAQSDFTLNADGGMTADIAVPDATGAWTKVGRWAMAVDAADTDIETGGWDYCPIGPLTITGAGPFEGPLRFTVNYADDSTEPS